MFGWLFSFSFTYPTITNEPTESILVLLVHDAYNLALTMLPKKVYMSGVDNSRLYIYNLNLKTY